MKFPNIFKRKKKAADKSTTAGINLDGLVRSEATTAHPFTASRNTAAAIHRDDDPLTIAIMHDLTLDSYENYPVPSFVSPPSTPSAPAPPSSPATISDIAYSYEGGSSSYDSGSSSSDSGGGSGGSD